MTPPATATRPTLLVVVAASEAPTYATSAFAQTVVSTTAAAVQHVERERPTAVIVDLDATGIDAAEICRAAAGVQTTSILVTTDTAARVPAALRAGCHAVLLKPFAPNLLVARLGRLVRERAQQLRFRSLPGGTAFSTGGTNRVWADTACPQCATAGATSFEFASYRRMWYACLSCDHVWLGARQE